MRNISSKLFSIIILVIIFSPYSLIFSADKIEFTIKNGFDWSLPAHVESGDNAGAAYGSEIPDKSYIKNVVVMIPWSAMNPDEGVYDFSGLNEYLNQANELDLKLILRLTCHVISRKSPYGKKSDDEAPFVPEWVVKKYNPKEFYTFKGSAPDKNDNGSNYYIKVAASWDAGVQKELKRFIEEFSRQGFLKKDALRGIYIHGFSSSYGEEFWLHRNHTKFAIEAGMTEAKLISTYKDRIDWWAAAAGANVNKLIWIHVSELQGLEYNTEVLNEYAEKKGLGLREGGLENYHRYLPPEYGLRFDNNYVSTDWSYPLRSENRYFGDELEVPPEYIDKSLTQTQKEHAVQSSIFRMSQLGINHVWTSKKFVEHAEDMFQWWLKTAGNIPKNSPDAACWLREDYFYDNKIISWKNYERFLFQRDFETAITRPVLKINRFPIYTDPKNMHFDFSARSTDIKNKQDSMLFFIDPDFNYSMGKSFEIKITYYDDSANKWLLELSGQENIISSNEIVNRNDGKWKTATFKINNTISTGSLPHDAFFRVKVIEGNDLTVKFVRIVK